MEWRRGLRINSRLFGKIRTNFQSYGDVNYKEFWQNTRELTLYIMSYHLIMFSIPEHTYLSGKYLYLQFDLP